MKTFLLALATSLAALTALFELSAESSFAAGQDQSGPRNQMESQNPAWRGAEQCDVVRLPVVESVTPANQVIQASTYESAAPSPPRRTA